MPTFPRMLHGADYNPEQWLETPEVWDEDFRLMRLCRMNSASVGIFSWSALEPEEGKFNFIWLDDIMSRMAKQGMTAVLATPSGARPPWLAQAYPEVLRMTDTGLRHKYGDRHNHCPTSPIYREKVAIINDKLANRYKGHPALGLWHVSNEYGGACHCPLCTEAFRRFLEKRYGSLDTLNEQYWSRFWSHRITNWAQINPPSSIGENCVPGLTLDWKRFVSAQTVDFFLHEIKPLRRHTPEVPVTTNFMGTYDGLDYQDFAKHVDVVSWDSYPEWHAEPETVTAGRTTFVHDLYRSLKNGQPFLLMESTPANTNWRSVCRNMRQGMQYLASMQAVAHGSDSVQYFQFRQSRGSHEKFHGAVVSHAGHENTRVFADVTKVGKTLEALNGLPGSRTDAQVAIVFDWENHWALQGLAGFNMVRKDYEAVCAEYHAAFWRRGIATDVISAKQPLEGYKLVVAPMLYSVSAQLGERIRSYVREGGTFVGGYLTALVNENDLCWLGGFPGAKLRDVFGLWNEETDGLGDDDGFAVRWNDAPVPVRHFAAHVHAETAQVLARYENSDYLTDTPALLCNRFGKGAAYYVAFRGTPAFTDELCQTIIEETGVSSVIGGTLPAGVSVTRRGRYLFILNFSRDRAEVKLPAGRYVNLADGTELVGAVPAKLESFGVMILEPK